MSDAPLSSKPKVPPVERVQLTPLQVFELAEYFDRVKAEATLGTPGILVAQLTYDQEGHYWMHPAFLPHDLAQLIASKGKTVSQV
jgi:hypothetical protein